MTRRRDVRVQTTAQQAYGSSSPTDNDETTPRVERFAAEPCVTTTPLNLISDPVGTPGRDPELAEDRQEPARKLSVTWTVTSSAAARSPSVPVSRSVYTPAAENTAVVRRTLTR